MPDDIKKRAIIDVRLETEKARKQAEMLRISITKLEAEQKRLKKALDTAITEKSLVNQRKYGKELTDVQTKLKRARTEFNQYAKEVNKGNEIFKRSGGLTKSITNSLTSMATQVISVYAAYRLLSRAVVGSIKDFTEFEKTLTDVQTLLTYNEQTLRRGALDIIPKYGLAIKDVNRALFDAISAGVPATESIGFLHEAAILAVGGVTDLRTAVDGLTSILNTYSLSTDYAAEVSDAFYTAQKYGKTTVEKLVNQIGRVAPIAQIANVSFQEMLGSLASLTKGGLNTEESVTILRQVISALIKPAHQASLVLKDASVPTGILAVRTKGLVFALEQLNKAYMENPDAIAKMIPNIRAFTGVAAFNAKRLVELKKIINDVYEDNTSLSRAFGEQMDTLQKKWEVAKGRVKAFRIEIGERLAPALKDMLDKFNRWSDRTKTQTELTEDATKQLDEEFNVLLRANYTKEQLAIAIRNINEQYAAYLPNLIDEKSSLEDIKKIQEDVILGLQERILYMAYEEELRKVYELTSVAANVLYENERRRTQQLMETKTVSAEALEFEKNMYESIADGWQKVIDSTDERAETIENKYKEIAKTLGSVFEDIKKKFEKIFVKPEVEAVEGMMELVERERLLAMILTARRKFEDEEIKLMEAGVDKKIAVETLRYERTMENLAGQIKDKEELSSDEIEFNKVIQGLIEQNYEVHLRNMDTILDQWLEKEKERKDKETEKDKKDAIRAAKAIVSFKKKYGIDSAKELMDDEIAAFEIQSKELELSQEEREKGLFNIKKKYWDDYIDMAIDMSADLSNMIMNFEIERKNRQYDHEMELLKNAKDAESQVLKNKLDKDLISEEVYKAAQDALAEKHERKRIALEKKKFEQDKKTAISQTIIAGIVAAARVIAEYWGTPMAWQMALAIGIKTLAEVGLISAQKYATGGMADLKDGIVKGIGAWNSDKIHALISPGEAIINAKSMANPVLRARASAINVAGGGVPFADGGMGARSVSAEVEQSFISANQIRTIVEAMPPQIVLVKDITTGIERVVSVEERANV